MHRARATNESRVAGIEILATTRLGSKDWHKKNARSRRSAATRIELSPGPAWITAAPAELFVGLAVRPEWVLRPVRSCFPGDGSPTSTSRPGGSSRLQGGEAKRDRSHPNHEMTNRETRLIGSMRDAPHSRA